MHRPDVAAFVGEYHAAIDAIVNDGDANQEALEGALSALETRLLTVCGLDATETDALLDHLYEES